jgi:hypothetical protein
MCRGHHAREARVEEALCFFIKTLVDGIQQAEARDR